MPRQRVDNSRWLEILKFVVKQKHGAFILCRSKRAEHVRQKLYIVKRAEHDSGNDSFDNLRISFSPHSKDILFVYPEEGRSA